MGWNQASDQHSPAIFEHYILWEEAWNLVHDSTVSNGGMRCKGNEKSNVIKWKAKWVLQAKETWEDFSKEVV